MSVKPGITFSVSEPSRVACAVGAFGDVVPRLAARLASLTDEALGALSGVGNDEALIVLGDEASLPWVDGVTYFARSDETPSLLFATTSTLDVPARLVARLLDPSESLAPIVLVPDDDRLRVYSVREAHPIAREKIVALASRDT